MPNLEHVATAELSRRVVQGEPTPAERLELLVRCARAARDAFAEGDHGRALDNLGDVRVLRERLTVEIPEAAPAGLPDGIAA